MSNFLAMLRQNQQQAAPSLLPDLGGIVQGLMSGYDQGLQDRRQRAADERQRLADAQAAEDRKLKLAATARDQKEAEYKFGMGRFKDLAQAGDVTGAANAYNGLVPMEQSLYPGLGSTPLVGGMRMLSNPELQGMDEQAIRNSLRLGDQGQVQFKTQDFNNDQTASRVMGLAGIKPEYKSYSQQDDVFRVMPGQDPTLVRPGTPKPVAERQARWSTYTQPDGTVVQYNQDNPSEQRSVGQTRVPSAGGGDSESKMAFNEMRLSTWRMDQERAIRNKHTSVDRRGNKVLNQAAFDADMTKLDSTEKTMRQRLGIDFPDVDTGGGDPAPAGGQYGPPRAGVAFQGSASMKDLTPWAQGLLSNAPLRGVIPATGTTKGNHPASVGSPRGHGAGNSIDYVPADEADEANAIRHFRSKGAYVIVEDKGTPNYHIHAQPPQGKPMPQGSSFPGNPRKAGNSIMQQAGIKRMTDMGE